MFATDGEAALHELQTLLSDPNIDTAVRQGDIYAVIVEFYAANNNFKSAINALQEMKSRLPKINPSFYVDPQTLQSIARNTGMNFSTTENGDLDEGGSEDEGNGSEEEVVEEDDDEDDRPQRNFTLNGSA
ncbi:hypothetical protein SK128_011844, partial [Halocaridina rubra]